MFVLIAVSEELKQTDTQTDRIALYMLNYPSKYASAIVLLAFIHPVFIYGFTQMVSTTISTVFKRDVLTTAFVNEQTYRRF